MKSVKWFFLCQGNILDFLYTYLFSNYLYMLSILQGTKDSIVGDMTLNLLILDTDNDGS